MHITPSNPDNSPSGPNSSKAEASQQGMLDGRSVVIPPKRKNDEYSYTHHMFGSNPVSRDSTEDAAKRLKANQEFLTTGKPQSKNPNSPALTDPSSSSDLSDSDSLPGEDVWNRPEFGSSPVYKDFMKDAAERLKATRKFLTNPTPKSEDPNSPQQSLQEEIFQLKGQQTVMPGGQAGTKANDSSSTTSWFSSPTLTDPSSSPDPSQQSRSDTTSPPPPPSGSFSDDEIW